MATRSEHRDRAAQSLWQALNAALDASRLMRQARRMLRTSYGRSLDRTALRMVKRRLEEARRRVRMAEPELEGAIAELEHALEADVTLPRGAA